MEQQGSSTSAGRGKAEKEFVKEITPQSVDYSQWYIDVVLKTELMDYAPVKGCMAIRPYGYAIWEKIQQLLDRRIKDTGHQNAYFPMFIPQELLQKEAAHVEGFAPEVALVTKGGGETLAEPLVVRPTSEAIICDFYSRWIQSWRDLPMLINQWCNVVRWEKVTRPFLRTSEFLWQEGHTCHRTEEEAEKEALLMLGVYKEFLETEMAIPVIAGRKTEREKFAGALRTYTVEALMRDGRALQAGTSHNLGQHFARVFDITFLDQDGTLKYVWQTSWGVSTRLIGALIMVHGDDRGLVLPPRIAPIQVVIVPIISKKAREEVLAAARRVAETLQQAGIRLKLDDREEYSPGWKFNEWEMKGVPLRLELGPRDLEAEQVIAVRRDSGAKEPLPWAELPRRLPQLLEELQGDLYKRALQFQQEHTRSGADYGEFLQVMERERGFFIASWCGREECELKAKEESKATIRCIPFDREMEHENCLVCGEKAAHVVYFARAY
ncbi:MAG: proline--tRNA ligase [Firmicutes bacterium]|jgi:prolyl-tRNA synthetase|nr:proline--tRNA ligase [Bacillota bacterium]HPU01843.1 proline--tRNA ligase [Bacillota bacterium]